MTTATEASKARSVLAYAPDEIFQKSWQTYQLVVDSGLLGHAKLASAIASSLADLRRARGRPLRILDLGSGDAGVLTRALAAEAANNINTSSSSSSSAAAAASSSPAADFVAQYTAVDESQPALALAAENVAKNLPGCEGRFHVGDLLSAAREAARANGGGGEGAQEESKPSSSSSIPPPEGGYDAIVASLSAHHLSTEEGKPALVSAARGALLAPPPTTTTTTTKAKGEEEKEEKEEEWPGRSLFIVADVFLRDGKGEKEEEEEEEEEDTVGKWRERSCAVIRERWPEREPALSADEAARIASHVGTCDIPTTLRNYEGMAKSAGFSRCAKVADVCEELGIRVVVMEA